MRSDFMPDTNKMKLCNRTKSSIYDAYMEYCASTGIQCVYAFPLMFRFRRRRMLNQPFAKDNERRMAQRFNPEME